MLPYGKPTRWMFTHKLTSQFVSEHLDTKTKGQLELTLSQK